MASSSCTESSSVASCSCPRLVPCAKGARWFICLAALACAIVYAGKSGACVLRFDLVLTYCDSSSNWQSSNRFNLTKAESLCMQCRQNRYRKCDCPKVQCSPLKGRLFLPFCACYAPPVLARRGRPPLFTIRAGTTRRRSCYARYLERHVRHRTSPG